jgi:hypothetical protein
MTELELEIMWKKVVLSYKLPSWYLVEKTQECHEILSQYLKRWPPASEEGRLTTFPLGGCVGVYC